MFKTKLLKIIGIVMALAMLTANGAVLSYADEGMYDLLQRDGKLRLIVKFKDFVSDRIALKLGEREGVANEDLNEYILQKIDQKYNLKKLRKLFKERELARTSGDFAQEFDDYFVIEVNKDEKYAEWVCSRLERFYEIEMVEPDIKVSIAATALPNVNYIPNDYYVTSDNIYWREGAWGQSYPDMWGLQKTQTFEAWDLFSNTRTDPGKNIVVAVIDTGVTFAHPDISANRWINPGEIAGNGVDDDGNGYVDDINGWDFVSNDNNPYDGHGHGTHVSGTIAAVTNNNIGVAGIAPNAKIMAVKGLSDSGSGYISGLANCIIYAANNGADILSNSWGGWGSSSTLTNAMNYAYSRGCVIIAAAGNSNADVSGFMPANIPNVIAVAATDHNDVKAYFSNYGTGIDVSAPGVKILSALSGSYASWSGTSMACPHVSGIAALILSQNPSLTNAEVRQRLKDTADNIDAQNPSYVGRLGTGRVNAYKAILAGGPPKHAPVLDPIGNKSVNEGTLLSFTISATDEDGDPLIYSMEVLPTGVTETYNLEDGQMPSGFTTGGNGRFYVQNQTAYQGSYALMADPSIVDNQFEYIQKTVTTLDGGKVSFYWKVSSEYYYDYLEFYIDGTLQTKISGETSWQLKSYNLSAGTHTLKWQYIKDYSVTTGQDTGWVDLIVIEGVEGESNSLPEGASFDPNTRTFTWTPTYNQAGTYSGIRFTVTEDTQDQRSDYEDITITVNDVNLPPVLNPIGNKTVNEMELLEFAITAADPEGDTLVYSASNLPTGATFNADTRTFSWTPTYQQSGTYENVHFEVADGSTTTSSQGGIDENTKLMLHCNGGDGSTEFIDNSNGNHALTATSGAALDSSTMKFGNGSLWLNGYSGNLTALDSSDWDLQTDFTIDLWVKHANHLGDETYVCQYENQGSGWLLFHSDGPGLRFWVLSNGSHITTLQGGEITDTNWHHVALTKVGTDWGLYLDGSQKGYVSNSSIGTFAGNLRIGNWANGMYFEGNMDEIRIYHGNPFEASPNSSLTDTITVPSLEAE